MFFMFANCRKGYLIGNNGCHFEQGFFQDSSVKKSLDKTAILLPHTTKSTSLGRLLNDPRSLLHHCLGDEYVVLQQ